MIWHSLSSRGPPRNQGPRPCGGAWLSFAVPRPAAARPALTGHRALALDAPRCTCSVSSLGLTGLQKGTGLAAGAGAASGGFLGCRSPLNFTVSKTTKGLGAGDLKRGRKGLRPRPRRLSSPRRASSCGTGKRGTVTSVCAFSPRSARGRRWGSGGGQGENGATFSFRRLPRCRCSWNPDVHPRCPA